MGIYKVKKEKFVCYNQTLQIRGTVFLPDREGERLPIAIVCHEFMLNRFFSYPYAKTLAEQGYAAFCFDFCGGGMICASEGSSRDMSVLTEVEDLKAVIAFAREQSYADGQRLLLMGCSQGGLVSAIVASELKGEAEGLILQYPALTIPEAAREGEMLMLHFDPSNIPDKMRAGFMKLGRKYASDVMGLYPFETIQGYVGNVLILHGDKDGIVDISNSEKAFDRYTEAGAKAAFRILPGAGHIFLRKKHIEEAQAAICEFVRRIKG